MNGETVDRLLSELRGLLMTYIYFPKPEQADAVSLWAAYTHAFARGQTFSFVPYLLITSAEKQSGKSNLLELLGMTTHQPLAGSDMSAALIARTCGGRTLLFDEIDGVYSGPDDDGMAGDLRTVFNAGFKYDGKYRRLDKKSLQPTEWSVYGPKAMAGIGRKVPDTVQDRSIGIRLAKVPPAVSLPKLRAARVEPIARDIRGRVASAMADLRLSFIDEMDFPAELDGRREDIWEPLFSLARAAGDDWWSRARHAAIVLTEAEPATSLGTELLADIREVFAEAGNPEMIPTTDLIGHPHDKFEGTQATGLCALEERPWATLSRGRPITPHRLAEMLREYDLKSERAWASGRGKAVEYGPKGFWLAALRRVWDTYLGAAADTSDTSNSPQEREGGAQGPATSLSYGVSVLSDGSDGGIG